MARAVTPRPRARPVVGVTTGRLQLGDRISDGTQRDYSAAVTQAGGLPLLVPSVPEVPAEEVAGHLDALLLTGGGDVDPARYGEPARPETSGVDPDRDQVELALLDACRDRALPVLGICRGCQLLNVAFGGSLVQELATVSERPHLVLGSRHTISHELQLEPDSGLRRVAGTDRLGVNSIHHQGIDRLGQALRAVARAEDGLVEGIEDADGSVLGVQWHPENLLDDAPSHLGLFRWLVQAAGGASADSRDEARVAEQGILTGGRRA